MKLLTAACLRKLQETLHVALFGTILWTVLVFMDAIKTDYLPFVVVMFAICCLIVYSCLVYYLVCLFFRGWGLRALDDIPMGTFVCTYAGQILNEDMANKVELRDFISLGLEKCLHVVNKYFLLHSVNVSYF